MNWATVRPTSAWSRFRGPADRRPRPQSFQAGAAAPNRARRGSVFRVHAGLGADPERGTGTGGEVHRDHPGRTPVLAGEHGATRTVVDQLPVERDPDRTGLLAARVGFHDVYGAALLVGGPGHALHVRAPRRDHREPGVRHAAAP